MKKLISGLIFFSVLAVSGNGYCSDAFIDEVRVDNGPDLKVSFTVKNAFTKEIEEAIKSGVPTSFTFFMELNRVNGHWFNEGVGKWQFRHTVKYDTLKEEFEITSDEDAAIKTKDFAEMKRAMSTASAITLYPVSQMVPGENYELRVMAELRTVKLPFLLNYMFFFVKYWDFETGWHTYGFPGK